jgi:hypothetical protein
MRMRVDAPAHVCGPLEAIANGVGATELGIHVLAVDHLEAEIDAFVFGMGLDAIEQRRRRVFPLLVADAAALAAVGNDVPHAVGRARVDRGVQSLLDRVVQLGANRAVAQVEVLGTGGRAHQAIFLQRGPVLLPDEFETRRPCIGRDAAHLVE